MEKKDYYLGLDIGTSSVGWAVTDKEYNLLRAKGKDLWGVRLFDEASTAADRRSKRTARRRLEREKRRKAILRELFADEINKIDSGFFNRLDESFFYMEDRGDDNKQKYTLFNDKDFTDKDFHREYKTIFHLRQQLLHSREPFDVRLVFLAIYNMFSHRGHFLNATLDATKNDSNFSVAYIEMVEACRGVDINLPETIDFNKLEEVLSLKGKSRTDILELIADTLSITKKNKREYELLKMICGLKVTVKSLYNKDSEELKLMEKDEKNKKFCFIDSNFEEEINDFINIVGDEWDLVIEKAKTVHDIGLLGNIMNGHEYISDARVASYDRHHEDLTMLKTLLKEYSHDDYEKIFRADLSGSYSAYVGSVNSHGKYRRLGDREKRDKESLYKTIEKALKKVPEGNEEKKIIIDKMKEKIFLEKQLTSGNGIIPNQVHSRELIAILNNAERYLPFLTKKDDKGISVSDKVVQLFRFQIPYYVGPLGKEFNGKDGYNVWAVRKKDGPIYPWNFSEKIDESESRKKFVKRMVRKCTYLSDEKTLPKQSLLYEKFMVLNEINSISIDGCRLSTKAKQGIYRDLFSKGKKVSKKTIKDYLISIGQMEPMSNLSGIDDKCNQSLTSIGKFYGIFGEDVNKESNKKLIEDIIFWGTVYRNDKKVITKEIEDCYKGILDKKQLKKVLGFKFEGWGNLSKAFLETMGSCKKTVGENSIINFMWDYQLTLNELMSDNFTFSSEINKKVNLLEKPLKEWKIEDLNDMYLSAPVKRMVWQSMKLVNEIVEVIGYPPSRLFIEMTRSKGKKIRTESRKNQLIDLYKSLNNEKSEWIKELEEKDESYFKIKKVYLYYLQQGKCMYSGDAIDFGKLLNSNSYYDIDHIYPQSYIKDDSILNNLVLVKSELNRDKSNKPLTSDIQNKMYGFWKHLKDKGFITSEKYTRLTRRNSEFTDKEKIRFINRQIVETGQATKVMTQIMQQSLGENCKVVFSKAKLVSDFRDKFKIPKARAVNDFHHANDAYLNIVVGNSYYAKFTNNPYNFIKKSSQNSGDSRYKYHLGKFFENDIRTKNEVAWIVSPKDESESETISTVKKVISKNTPLITKKVKEGHGAYYDETVYSKDVAKYESYIGVKTDNPMFDVKKYGGKSYISRLGYSLVEYEKKKKKYRILEAIPILLGTSKNITEEKLYKYFREKYLKNGLVEEANSLRVCKKFIPRNSLIKKDGFLYYLGGKTGPRIEVNPAMQLKMKPDFISYIQKVEKANKNAYYLEKDKNGIPILSKEYNVEIYKFFIEKFSVGYLKNRVADISSILNEHIEGFISVGIDDQCKIIERILNNISNNFEVDLRALGGGKKIGYCRISNRISNSKEFKLIHQSITGLYEFEEDLLSL